MSVDDLLQEMTLYRYGQTQGMTSLFLVSVRKWASVILDSREASLSRHSVVCVDVTGYIAVMSWNSGSNIICFVREWITMTYACITEQKPTKFCDGKSFVKWRTGR
jgi:hypothetical protein